MLHSSIPLLPQIQWPKHMSLFPWQIAFPSNVPNFHQSELISSGLLNFSLWNSVLPFLSLYSITKFCYFFLCKAWILSCDISIGLTHFHVLLTSGVMSSPDLPLGPSLLVPYNHCQIYVPEYTGFLSVLLHHVALTTFHNQYCWYITSHFENLYIYLSSMIIST